MSDFQIFAADAAFSKSRSAQLFFLASNQKNCLINSRFLPESLVGKGVQKNPQQKWSYLSRILSNSFPNFRPRFSFSFLFQNQLLRKMFATLCNKRCDGLD